MTGFEPGTFRVTAGSLIRYAKFPYVKIQKILSQILRDFFNLSEADSASRIKEQSAISFEKTKNKNR